MRLNLAVVLTLTVSAVAHGQERWSSPEADKEYMAELRAFVGSGARFPGSPGNLRLEEKVAQAFAATAFEHGEIKFRTPVFRPGASSLTLGGERYTIQPMHPTLMRPGNFKQDTFEAPLAYLGRAGVEDLAQAKGVDLNGAVAVVDFDCAGNWLRLMRFGIKGVIFAGQPAYEAGDALQKEYETEVATARFFINEADGKRLIAAIRTSKAPPLARFDCKPSIWENAYLRDLWVVIPGADEQLKNEVCVICAPIDTDCIVPEQAAGGQSGANLFLLMRLLKVFQQAPPARTVMLAALNGHTQNFLGERMLATHLLAPDKDAESVRDLILQDMKLEQMYARHYREIHDALEKVQAEPGEGAASQAANEMLSVLRTQIDDATGKQLLVKKPLISRLARDANQAKTRSAEPEMAKENAQLVKIQMLFNKFGETRRIQDLAPDELALLIKYVKDVLDENTEWSRLNQADLALSQANNGVRTALQSRGVPWVLYLGLSWRGGQLGFTSGEYWGNPDWRNRFGAKLVELSENLTGVKAGRRNLLADTMTFNAALNEAYYFSTPQNVFCFQAAQNTPAFALQNVFSFGNRVFTPSDTFEQLDPAAVGETSAYTEEFLRAMLAADASSIGKLNRRPQSWSIQIKTMEFNDFSTDFVLPDEPVGGTFVTIRTKFPPHTVQDVSTVYTQLTDSRATAAFYGLKEIALSAYGQFLFTAAFQMDENYREVVRTIDGGEKEGSLSSNLVQTSAQTYVMFRCQEFPIYTRDSSPSISAGGITIDEFRPLDAKRESVPRQLGAAGIVLTGSDKKYLASPGPASVFAPPGTRLKIIGSIPGLKVIDNYPEGEGFQTAADLGPDFFAAATRDLDSLNRYRLGRLHGVSIELASDFLKKGKQALSDAAEKKSVNDHIGFVQALQTAAGAECQTYGQLQDITRDMLRGVLFYMALILPFCFFMQKLLFNFVKIEAQIAAFFVLFVGAYVLFRQIHPAFAVAKAPEGLLIAFCMGGLATFVIKILHGRFEGEMAMLFQNYIGSDSPDVGYGTVGQKAMLIGVNNMRRRRVRTTLTTATIVLITFTMLSFTSISQTISPTQVNISRDPPPYTGIMYHWPGKRMDEATLSGMQELFHGKGDVIVRRWLLPPYYAKATFPFAAIAPSGKVAHIDSALGLSVLEDGFLGKFPLLSGRYFSSDDANEVLVPPRVADALGVDRDRLAGATLRLNDVDLAIVGIVDDEALRRLKDLDGLMLIPQKEGQIAEDASAGAAGGGTGGASKDQSGLYNDTASMLVIPVGRAMKYGGAPYSVSVRFNAENQNVWKNVLHILTVTHANFYVGSQAPFKAVADDEQERDAKNGTVEKNSQTIDAGVYYIGSGFKTSANNLSSLIVPLLISGTIILNTMLGSVFERKKEIAIYNAIGLNPNHIGMFFLSEAFVYGIIGSVGGYLIGQLLSILLINLGISGIDLNFASLKVIYVILFVIAMVLLSTLYPAIVATRAAVPSGKRKWSFPEHDGNSMKIVFPFIYQPDVVSGIIEYLEEYFQRFTEASMGDLIASNMVRRNTKDANGRDVYTLACELALAPFDLGVTQRVFFTAAYNERVQCYGITLEAVRASGQDTNWVTTNKPFLERLRTYLMHWRSLSAQEQTEYAKAAAIAVSTGELDEGNPLPAREDESKQ